MDTRGHQLSPTYTMKRDFFSVWSGRGGVAVNIFLIPCQWTSPPDNGDVNYV